MGVDVQECPAPLRVHGHKVWKTWTNDECPCQIFLVVQYTCTDDQMRNAQIVIGPGTAGQEKFDLLWAWMDGKTADEVVMKVSEAGFGSIFMDAYNCRLPVVEVA